MIFKKRAGKTIKRGTSSGTKKTASSSGKMSRMGEDELFYLIQKKAYEYYVKRGYTHGDDQADWYRAEREAGKGLK